MSKVNISRLDSDISPHEQCSPSTMKMWYNSGQTLT